MFFSVMTLFSVIMLNDARNCVLMGSGDLCHSVGLETFRQTKKSDNNNNNVYYFYSAFYI